MSHKSAATLSVINAPAMGKRGRRMIINWLKKQIVSLEKDGHLYTEGRFTARYMYPGKSPPVAGTQKGPRS